MNRKICIVVLIAMILLSSCSSPVQAPVPSAPVQTMDTQEGNIIVQPDNQIVYEGSACSFVAIHREFMAGTWHFVSPSGDADIEIGMITDYFPDLGVYSDEYTELLICNITKELDGWSVYCEFEDGAKTRDAQIKVNPYL